ncbi:MAG: DUF3820 family protein [Chlamydiota bacterium]
MGLITKETFVCFDCEATGLDPKSDRIIEIAAVKFTFEHTLAACETLIDPGCKIPQASTNIHHITDKMVEGKPKIGAVLSQYLDLIDNHFLVGHGIPFDIALIEAEAKRSHVASSIGQLPFFDTLRMARLYGESPTNSLDTLRRHFNIESDGAHRAMNDVLVNIQVFKHLSKSFKTTQDLLKRLEKPIFLKKMPLGKHKGRLLSEIPTQYLEWAAHQKFDRDLSFSLRSELKKRKAGNLFQQASNPFSSL